MDTFKQTEEMKQRGWEVSVPLLHHDVREAYDSALKIKRRADIILALHDPSFIRKEIVALSKILSWYHSHLKHGSANNNLVQPFFNS